MSRTGAPTGEREHASFIPPRDVSSKGREDLFVLGHNRIRLDIERLLRLAEPGLGADGLVESSNCSLDLFRLRQPAAFKDLG